MGGVSFRRARDPSETDALFRGPLYGQNALLGKMGRGYCQKSRLAEGNSFTRGVGWRGTIFSSISCNHEGRFSE